MALPALSRLALLSVVAFICVDESWGQRMNKPGPFISQPRQFMHKPGRCSPGLMRSICHDLCQTDTHCPNHEKCCRTHCGGHVCSKPVTYTKPMLVKQGQCPDYAEGPWHCSSTCGMDGDCPGSLKCCRNKCGARICYPPL